MCDLLYLHLSRKIECFTTYGLDSDVGKNCLASLGQYILLGRHAFRRDAYVCVGANVAVGYPAA